eukprot:TRINITY_DN7370_c0_g1_i2.p1 TRINITY_DN7370_c0_g1~~TRINITY_DN7370_c0_g1_i2.p1  ORF type:complete len:110 (-),score=11.06 TRINITY_DN7370_c0_g1_i2:168-497(-)
MCIRDRCCHMYYLPKCFSDQAIQSRTHMCTLCLKALEHDRLPGRHCRKLPFDEWPQMPAQDNGRREWKSGPWTITAGSEGPRPPWVADEPACDRFRRTSSSYGAGVRNG